MSSRTRPNPLAVPGALLSALLLFKVIDAFLLLCDGVLDAWAGRLWTGLYFVGLVAVLWLASGLKGWRRWVATGVQGGLVAVVLAFLGRITAAPIEKGQTYLWLAQEWHKMPDNLLLMARFSPIITCLALAAVSVIAGVGSRAGARIAGAVLMAATFAYSLVAIREVDAGARAVVYVIVFSLPIVICALASAAGRMGLFAQAGIPVVILVLLLSHYVGHLPLSARHPDPAVPGMEKLYPRAGEEAQFPLVFLRDFYLDAARGFLFTSYGPTSGLIRLDLRSKKVDLIPTENGVVRHVRGEDGPDAFYAVDWIEASLLVVSKDPFVVREKMNLFGGGLVAPTTFTLGKQALYVASSEYPGMLEIQRDGLVRGRWISFCDLGITRYKSGVWGSALTADEKKLFAVVGLTGIEGTYELVKIDTESFQLEARASIPEGGNNVIEIPDRGGIVTTSYYSDRLYELDARTLARRRVLKGAFNPRNIVYSKKHGVILSVGFLPGELVATRYDDGATVAKAKVGPRPLSLFLREEDDSLYLGSGAGIFRLDLSRWLPK